MAKKITKAQFLKAYNTIYHYVQQTVDEGARVAEDLATELEDQDVPPNIRRDTIDSLIALTRSFELLDQNGDIITDVAFRAADLVDETKLYTSGAKAACKKVRKVQK